MKVEIDSPAASTEPETVTMSEDVVETERTAEEAAEITVESAPNGSSDEPEAQHESLDDETPGQSEMDGKVEQEETASASTEEVNKEQAENDCGPDDMPGNATGTSTSERVVKPGVQLKFEECFKEGLLKSQEDFDTLILGKLLDLSEEKGIQAMNEYIKAASGRQIRNKSGFMNGILRRVFSDEGSDYNALVDELPPPVRDQMKSLVASGKIKEGELEPNVVRNALSLGQRGCLDCLDRFANSSLDTVRSKTAFFVGITKRYRNESPRDLERRPPRFASQDRRSRGGYRDDGPRGRRNYAPYPSRGNDGYRGGYDGDSGRDYSRNEPYRGDYNYGAPPPVSRGGYGGPREYNLQMNPQYESYNNAYDDAYYGRSGGGAGAGGAGESGYGGYGMSQGDGDGYTGGYSQGYGRDNEFNGGNYGRGGGFNNQGRGGYGY